MWERDIQGAWYVRVPIAVHGDCETEREELKLLSIFCSVCLLAHATSCYALADCHSRGLLIKEAPMTERPEKTYQRIVAGQVTSDDPLLKRQTVKTHVECPSIVQLRGPSTSTISTQICVSSPDAGSR